MTNDRDIISLVGFNDFSVCDKAEQVGFVFPCYGGNAPDIVLESKNRILSNIHRHGKYIFAVISFNSSAMGHTIVSKMI